MTANSKEEAPPLSSRPFLLASCLVASTLAVANSTDPFAVEGMTHSTVAGGIVQGDAACRFAPLGSAPLALADVVVRALCSNPQTSQAWATARFQAAQVGVSNAAYRPSVNAVAGASLNNASGSLTGADTNERRENASLSLSYLLYDFGARAANLENARQVLGAANATQDATLQTVFGAAVQAYYQLLAAQAAVTAAKESETSNQESLKAATARYEDGVGTPADRLQAQTAYSQALLNRVQAEGNLRIAKGILANAMGQDANAEFEVTPSADAEPPAQYEADVGKLIGEARRQRPDLVAAEAQINAAKAGIYIARTTLRPAVSLSTSIGAMQSSITDFNRTAALGVQIAIPLYNGHSTDYRIRAAEEQVKLRQAQRDQISQQIALDVWSSYQTLMTQTQSVRYSQDLLASASQSANVALGRYRSGVGNIIDLVTAQAALASAKQQAIQATFNWQIARVTLAQRLGQLDMSLVSHQP